MTSFEDELHRALDQRAKEGAATLAAEAQALQWFREYNAPARQEAVRRLRRIAEDVRNFLTHHKIPPREIVAGRTSRIRGQHLVHVASGWSVGGHFVSLEGRFTQAAPGVLADHHAMARDQWIRSKVKPSQHYIGHYAKDKDLTWVEEQEGVWGAIFVPESKPVPQRVMEKVEFATYYYASLAQSPHVLKWPGTLCPDEALLLTPGGSELRLARLNSETRQVNFKLVDKEIAESALKVVESHQAGRRT